MKKKKIKLIYKNRNIFLEVLTCNWFEKIIGLMFSRREEAKILLFEFKKPVKLGIHSWFVFFPFTILWLDNFNKIISVVEVSPFRLNIKTNKRFKSL